ncbi:Protein of unknown function [Pyronema omphalodes CBS 100304]|uniref:Uncharacterized protein n=1 Tax=Pyronema omphalodes (strain CBS 100304) TaxID=1076935 RepID=U4KU73_PYROM|nr:Protein of unknown function [Pyronema omphalodes CBS 100304]
MSDNTDITISRTVGGRRGLPYDLVNDVRSVRPLAGNTTVTISTTDYTEDQKAATTVSRKLPFDPARDATI